MAKLKRKSRVHCSAWLGCDSRPHSLEWPKGIRRVTEAVQVALGRRMVLRASPAQELLSNPKALEAFAETLPWRRKNLCLVHALALADIRQDHPEWIQREENRRGLVLRRILAGIGRVFGMEGSYVCCGGSQPNDPSSATRPTRALDCNLDAMAGFAAAHG